MQNSTISKEDIAVQQKFPWDERSVMSSMAPQAEDVGEVSVNPNFFLYKYIYIY